MLPTNRLPVSMTIWMEGGDVRLSDNQGEIWGLFGTLGGSRPVRTLRNRPNGSGEAARARCTRIRRNSVILGNKIPQCA